MNKKSYKIKKLYDATITLNDTVFLIDGSALTLVVDDEYADDKQYYIIDAYPEITGSNLNLQAIKGTVIEINIKDRIALGFINVYLQDIIVQIGNAKFRTCSGLVSKQQKHLFIDYIK